MKIIILVDGRRHTEDYPILPNMGDTFLADDCYHKKVVFIKHDLYDKEIKVYCK